MILGDYYDQPESKNIEFKEFYLKVCPDTILTDDEILYISPLLPLLINIFNALVKSFTCKKHLLLLPVPCKLSFLLLIIE